jgi:hypothetical protein
MSGESYSYTFFNFENVDVFGYKYLGEYDECSDSFVPGTTPIPGWKVGLYKWESGTYVLVDTKFTDENGYYEFENVGPGLHKVEEIFPPEECCKWISISDTYHEFTPTSGGGPYGSYDFQNICFEKVYGKTIGFWTNKNGERLFDEQYDSNLQLLIDLNLMTSETEEFDPSNYREFKDWLKDANAEDMTYMLSAQLAATALNVANDVTDGEALVYLGSNPYTTMLLSVNEIIEEANKRLEEPTLYTKAELEFWKNACDMINNSKAWAYYEGICCINYPELSAIQTDSTANEKAKGKNK